MRKTNKKGFTIVELVIVIAVIAILASILIPTFSGIIGTAVDAASAADAKAIYSEYVTAQIQAKEEVAENGYVITEANGDTYYYVIADGQVGAKYENADDAKAAVVELDSCKVATFDDASATVGNFYALTGETHTPVDTADGGDGKCDGCGADMPTPTP